MHLFILLMSLSIGTWCHCRYCDWIIRRIGDLHLPLPSSLHSSTSLLCPTTNIGLCSTTTCHLCCPTIRSTSTLRPTCCVCGCTTTTIPTIVSTTTTTTSWNLCSNAIKEQKPRRAQYQFLPIFNCRSSFTRSSSCASSHSFVFIRFCFVAV